MSTIDRDQLIAKVNVKHPRAAEFVSQHVPEHQALTVDELNRSIRIGVTEFVNFPTRKKEFLCESPDTKEWVRNFMKHIVPSLEQLGETNV